MVAVVEEILRTRINYKQDDWESLIPALLFVLMGIAMKGAESPSSR